jgi:hypothetical protein
MASPAFGQSHHDDESLVGMSQNGGDFSNDASLCLVFYFSHMTS